MTQSVADSQNGRTPRLFRWGTQPRRLRRDAALGPPVASAPVVERSRLYGVLDEAVRRRVVVVSALSGAGKTLTLASWLNTDPTRATAWVRIVPEANDPPRFWSVLLDAIRPHLEQAAPRSVPRPEVVTPEDFLDAACELSQELLLVVDDAHLLTSRAALDGLEIVLRDCPDQLRLILSGRGMPRLSLARLRVAGQVADIGFDALACTREEGRELLRVLGIDVPDQEISEILAHTEGWMTGLRLAALWWSQQPSDQRSFADFTGSARVVADYMNDEVLRGQAWARPFLLRTCLVESLTGELADALTGEHNGSRILDDLERANMLTAATDPRRSWYRYRPLLREFLLAELHRQLPQEVGGLRRRAAAWYAQAGLTLDALTYAEEAADWPFAVKLLVTEGDKAVEAGPDDKVTALLDRIPDACIDDHPQLAAVYARARLKLADPEGAEPYLRVVDQAPSSGAPKTDEHLAHTLRRSELRLLQQCLRGDVKAQDVASAEAALEVTPTASVLHSLHTNAAATAYQLGIAELWRGRLHSARDALDRAMAECVRSDTWREKAWYAAVSAVEGRLADARQCLDDLAAVPSWKDADGRAAPQPAAVIRLTCALICLERDRLEEARLLLDPAAFGVAPGQAGEPPLAETAALCRARLMTIWGDFAGARGELLLARRTGAGFGARLSHTADLFEAELLLADQDLEGARKLLVAAIDSAPVPHLATDAVALGRLHIAARDPGAALAAVTPCLDQRTAETRLLDLIGAHLVAATAHRLLGSEAAKEHIEHALALAEPHGLVRVFLDGGRIVRSLLTVVAPQHSTHDQIRSTILHRFDCQPVKALDRGRDQVTLTTSETAVLRYLPSHLTTAEIADDLCVSVNTIKSHLRSIYRKLEVAQRREAISRAQQLDLLP